MSSKATDSQRGFQVFQFCETLESCVLPTDWVKNGEVKYNSKKASEYVRSGKQPYKKWPTYKVRLLCDKVFDSYNRAYQAETILLNKSDLDSSDVENLYRPNLVLNKKRQRKQFIIPGAIVVHKNATSETEESNDEGSVRYGSIDNPPPAPSITKILAKTQDRINNTCDGLLENTVTNDKTQIQDDKPVSQAQGYGSEANTSVFSLNEQTLTDPINTFDDDINNNGPVFPQLSSVVVHENIPVTLASSDDIKELKDIILGQNTLIQEQNKKIDALMAMVLELSKRGKKRGHNTVDEFYHTNVNADLLEFSYEGLTLPLETLESITQLEELLKDEVILKRFRSFLLQLGGHNLKMVVKHIVRKVYSLELQGRVNYTGREGKCSMGSLQQTKIIIEVMQQNTGKTEAEAIDEYMYHMQHVSDRVRSAKRMAGKNV